MKLQKAQKLLQERHLDGWLLYDFHRSNPLAHQFLELPSHVMATRRFFYWIPAIGEPIKLVHAIEPHMLDSAPGEKRVYSSWQQLEAEVGRIVKGHKRIAMEYSPRNQIPYVSKVDGGTIDLIRSFGAEVVSSADFLLYFTSTLTQAQMESQRRAAHACEQIVEAAWNWVKEGVSEWEICLFIQKEFEKRGLVTDAAPIVAINEHSADPHFETKEKGAKQLRKGDFLLIDLWAKEEKGIFGDLTRVAVMGNPSPKHEKIFHIVRDAQQAAIALVRKRFQEGKEIQGWEVDEAARSVVREAGFGDYFIHRTGHNIGADLHGSGTHMDNLEMHDVRPIIRESCFSVEPGIYLPGEFGVRLESDVLIDQDGTVEITGGEERHLVVIDRI